MICGLCTFNYARMYRMYRFPVRRAMTLIEKDFPMPFVDTNDSVFLYETFRAQESAPDMARRAAKTVCPICGST
jgi:hypothetical protein